MKRKLFTLASVLSLLLCLTTVALWVRSIFVADYLRWRYGFGDRLGNDVLEVQVETSKTGLASSAWYHRQGDNAFFGGPLHVPKGVTVRWFHSSTREDLKYPYFSSRVLWRPSKQDEGDFSVSEVDWHIFQAGAQRTRGPRGYIDRHWWATIPIPLIVAIAAFLPIRRARGFYHDLQRRAGRCGVGGYDLRASPERCPECGSTVRNKATA